MIKDAFLRNADCDLANHFLPSDTFLTECSELDHAGDIDYVAKVGDKTYKQNHKA
jgi:hypothetical protein